MTYKEKIREELKKYACGDSSCIFCKPTGMMTNGGCQTLKDNHETRIVLQQLVRFLRELIEK